MPCCRAILKMWQNKGLIQFQHSGNVYKLTKSYHDDTQLIVDLFKNKRDLFMEVQLIVDSPRRSNASLVFKENL